MYEGVGIGDVHLRLIDLFQQTFSSRVERHRELLSSFRDELVKIDPFSKLYRASKFEGFAPD